MTWELYLARPLLLLHALTGFGALAISFHVLYFAWRGMGKGGAGFRIRARFYASITWFMYLGAMITGAVVYPAYSVEVRAPYLDVDRPDLTGWFEIKEHWGAVGLLLAWGMWRYLCRSSKDDVLLPESGFWRGHVLLLFLLILCIVINVVVGSWVVMVKSV